MNKSGTHVAYPSCQIKVRVPLLTAIFNIVINNASISGNCLLSCVTDFDLFTCNLLHEQNGSREKVASKETKNINGKGRKKQTYVADFRHADIEDRHLSMVRWTIRQF